MIPLSVPDLRGNEKKYILDALDQGWVSAAGSYVTRFEQEMAAYLKTEGTAAVQSGTAALHLALLLSGVKRENEVIVPTLTFIAAVNPVKYIGAEPVFMDCDDTLNMDCDKLEDFLKKECTMTSQGLQNKRSGRIIKALVAVHVFGNMADMERLVPLTRKYGLRLTEDATEALGTCYREGACKEQFAGTMGDFGAYSFNGNKIITTGGGGMLAAKDAGSLKKAQYLASQAKDDPRFYVHNEIGYNYRMTNLQAALGVAQLEYLEEFIQIKEKNYNYYKDALGSMDGLKLLPFQEKARCNHWFYSLFLQDGRRNRDDIMEKLKEKGIETRPVWQLIHRQKMYRDSQAYRVEKAPFYQSRVISLPCSTGLHREEMDCVIQALKSL
ncbi:LegC family aminotransferase [Lachnospiraceae bacterium 54-53]